MRRLLLTAAVSWAFVLACIDQDAVCDVFVPVGDDIQAAIDGAVDGECIILEVGIHTIDKPIVIQGRGLTIAGDTSMSADDRATLRSVSGAGVFEISGVIAVPIEIQSLSLEGDPGTIGQSAMDISQSVVRFFQIEIQGFNAVRGGAIQASNAELDLQSCVVSGCISREGGSGFWLVGSTGTFSGLLLASNQTTGQGNTPDGGAISAFNSNLTFDDCTLEANETGNGFDDGPGAAVYAYESDVTFRSSDLLGNSSSSNGGAIAIAYGNLLLVDCAIRSNQASKNGGAVHANHGFVTIASCVFDENTAYGQVLGGNFDYGRGGAVAVASGTLDAVDCVFQSNQAEAEGGAIALASGAMNVVDCMFHLNQAEAQGGAFRAEQGLLTVANCDFVENLAFSDGGAISLEGSEATFAGTVFHGNTVSGDCGRRVYPGVGGGIDATDCIRVDIHSCEFRENSANFGGAVDLRHSAFDVVECHFVGNTSIRPKSCSSTFGDQAWGAGIGTYYSDGMISGSTFEGNHAEGNGGAVSIVRAEKLDIVACAFTDNGAGVIPSFGRGGGVFIYHSNPTLTNCMFEGNEGEIGGGVSCYHSGPTLANCIFTGNSASSGGGGLYSGVESMPTLRDTLICGNSPDQLQGAWNDDGGNTVGCQCPGDACQGDLDDDGEVSGFELGQIFVQWGACSGGCELDLDCDGSIGGIDLGLLFALWGPCK